MSSNSDNAMARFLFAILQQKNLKDIDWNKVAKDPILAQPISNGHAARMRFSRFRSSMLSLEPQRRNRANTAKSRPSSKAKRTTADDAVRTEEADIKLDPGAAECGSATTAHVVHPSPSRPAPEMFQSRPGPKSATASSAIPLSISTATAVYPEGRTHFHGRLLTPCSDVDAMMAPQGLAGSPTSDTMHGEPAFDFASPGQCGHDGGSWHSHSPTYPPFGTLANDMDCTTGFCEHDSHQRNGLCMPAAVMDPDRGHVNVKHEAWEPPYHTI